MFWFETIENPVVANAITGFFISGDTTSHRLSCHAISLSPCNGGHMGKAASPPKKILREIRKNKSRSLNLHPEDPRLCFLEFYKSAEAA